MSSPLNRLCLLADATHVSHSVVNLQKSARFFEAMCKSLPSIMQSHGHARIDLLKMDIEGAEYAVLDSIIRRRIDIGILYIEFDELHHHTDGRHASRIRDHVSDLIHGMDYRLVAAERGNYTFVKNRLSNQPPRHVSAR